MVFNLGKVKTVLDVFVILEMIQYTDKLEWFGYDDCTFNIQLNGETVAEIESAQGDEATVIRGDAITAFNEYLRREIEDPF